MPIKQHVDAPPLSASWRWLLMTGTLPTVRMYGWVEQMQTLDHTTAGDMFWEQHSASLIAEARAAGFTPYWVAQQAPAGAGFRRWADAFLALQTY